MNNALPVLIFSRNDELRILIREMLGKNGFFHVLEATFTAEALKFYQEHQQSTLSFIHVDVIETNLLELVVKSGKYIIISPSEDPRTIQLSAKLGVGHVISFPFSSYSLMDKITEILQ